MLAPTNATDSGIDSPVQKSAFLDSLELVSLFKLWDVCASADVSLDDTLNWAEAKWQRLKAALESAGIAANVLRRPEDVNRGLNLYSNLGPKSNEYRFFTSHVCWSEMQHVLLESIALEHLVHQGIPLSLREKRPQFLYRGSLSETDFGQVDDRVEAFRESLELDYGMRVTSVEDTSTGIDISPVDIWHGAQVIWSHVLMTAIDAYVCAAAILIEVDAFVTGDSSRRDVLARLHDPGDEWRMTADSVVSAFGLQSSEKIPKPITALHPLP